MIIDLSSSFMPNFYGVTIINFEMWTMVHSILNGDDRSRLFLRPLFLLIAHEMITLYVRLELVAKPYVYV